MQALTQNLLTVGVSNYVAHQAFSSRDYPKDLWLIFFSFLFPLITCCYDSQICIHTYCRHCPFSYTSRAFSLSSSQMLLYFNYIFHLSFVLITSGHGKEWNLCLKLQLYSYVISTKCFYNSFFFYNSSSYSYTLKFNHIILLNILLDDPYAEIGWRICTRTLMLQVNYMPKRMWVGKNIHEVFFGGHVY